MDGWMDGWRDRGPAGKGLGAFAGSRAPMSTIRCSVDLPREVVATLGGKSFQTQRLSGKGLNNGVHYTIMFVLPTPKFF